MPIALLEVESLSDEQVRILASAPNSVPGGPFGSQTKIRLPKLTTLDSALLAETLLRRSADFAGVTGFAGVKRISPEAAAALGRVPDAVAGPRGSAALSFPSLEELSPETAGLLMNRSWPSISLPSLRNALPETVRSLVRQTSSLTLGVSTMTPELASVFGEMASNKMDLGGGQLAFPCLTELSPEAARILVESLNRGEEVPGWGGLNRSPQMFIGGRGLGGVAPPLTPALAGELAKYRGRLSIAGLRELSPESAAALVPYRGTSIELSGSATDKLSPETAAALATFPGNLTMPLRVLDSLPLAEKFARQSSRGSQSRSVAEKVAEGGEASTTACGHSDSDEDPRILGVNHHAPAGVDLCAAEKSVRRRPRQSWRYSTVSLMINCGLRPRRFSLWFSLWKWCRFRRARSRKERQTSRTSADIKLPCCGWFKLEYTTSGVKIKCRGGHSVRPLLSSTENRL